MSQNLYEKPFIEPDLDDSYGWWVRPGKGYVAWAWCFTKWGAQWKLQRILKRRAKAAATERTDPAQKKVEVADV